MIHLLKLIITVCIDLDSFVKLYLQAIQYFEESVLSKCSSYLGHPE